MNPKSMSNNSQKGVVLVVGLIMLLLLMIIGTAGMKSTIMEEKMAGNMRMNNLVFQAAESALAAAEAKLRPVAPAVMPTFTQAGTNGFYSSDTTILPSNSVDQDILLNTASFWTSNPVATSTVNNLGNGIDTPQYIIQKLNPTSFPNPPNAPVSLTPYKVTVRAARTITDPADSTKKIVNNVVILQSVYAL